MTLSRFLRDYLYIPLGGNRHGLTRQLAALLITDGTRWALAWCGMDICDLGHSARNWPGRRCALAPLVVPISRPMGWAMLMVFLLSILGVLPRAQSRCGVERAAAMVTGGGPAWPRGMGTIVIAAARGVSCPDQPDDRRQPAALSLARTGGCLRNSRLAAQAGRWTAYKFI